MSLTLELALRSLFHDLLDLIVSCTLLDAARQVHDGDVGGGHTHRHAGELAIEIGDDLSDGLGGTGGRWDDVLGGATASTPILTRGTVDGLLGGGVGVDGGHQALDHGVLLVDDLGEGCQAVGGAGCVGDDGDVRGVGLVVDAHDEHWRIGRGGRDDDLLRAALQMRRRLLGGGEDTGGLDDVFRAGFTPRDGGRVFLHVKSDLLAVDDQILAVDFDRAIEQAVGRIVFEHVCLLGFASLEQLPRWGFPYGGVSCSGQLLTA